MNAANSLRNSALACLFVAAALSGTGEATAQSGQGYQQWLSWCHQQGGQDVGGPNRPNCVLGKRPESPPAQMQVDLTTVFHLPAVQEANDFWIQLDDRRMLPAREQINLPIKERSGLVTGPNGSARFDLADGTKVTLGPGTEVVLKKFQSSPGGAPADLWLTLVKGRMRWQHKVEQYLKRFSPRITVGCCITSVRHTDIEYSQEPGGSGFVRLNEGVIEFSDLDGGAPVEMHAGQTLRFENFQIVGVE